MSVILDNGAELVFEESSLRAVCRGIEYTFQSPTASRFYPLYEMAMGINTKISSGTLTHRDGYIFKDFK